MDAILQWISTDVAGNQRSLFVVAVAATVFLFFLGLSYVAIAATDPARRRLLELLGPRRPTGRFAQALIDWLRPAAHLIEPSDAEERQGIQQQLVWAGFRTSSALPLFYAIKIGLALLFVIAVLFAAPFLPKASSMQLLIYGLAAAGLGLLLPSSVLTRLVARRQKRLRDGFPDALDMLVVCVEAGLGLTAALQRVADELRFSHPELAAELALVTAEMRAGVERDVALRALTNRTGLEDVRGLVSLLIQTLRFGTSIGDTLRVYSEEFRDKRMQRAEELAAKIGTKLIFPLVLCLFPSFFTVAVGPAVIRIVDAFKTLAVTVGK